MTVTVLVLGPIIIGLILYALPRGAGALARGIGVAVAVLTFLLIAIKPDAPDASLPWLARPFTAAFHLGYGPISYWIVLMLAAVTFGGLIALRVPRERDFTAQMLILQGAMTGVFLAKDVLLFALFWDLMLIPVFLLMLGWGRPARGARSHGTAAWRYLIYNVAGGLTLLLATAAFGVVNGSTDVIGAHAAPVTIGYLWGPWIFAGFAFAFLIKTPVWPLHTWMPDTYAELPPPVVAAVSAVQSKAGLYGFIAIGLPFLSEQMRAAAPLMFVLGLVALLYGAFIALTEDDAKRVLAYSSLSHLGLILIAIFSFNPIALAGAAVYIIAHGLFSASGFLTLGFIEEREETRSLSHLGGLAADNPRMSGALLITSLAALGLPGLAGFAGEILILTGVYAAGFWWAALIALIPIVIAAGYMLRLFQTIMQGPKRADLPERHDLTWIEGFALVPLVLGLVLLGVNPHAVASFAVDATTEGTSLPALASFATPADVNALLPASIVALTALVALFFDLLAPAATRRALAVAVATIGLIAAGIVLAMQYGHPYAAFGGAFFLGGFSVVFSEIVIIATIATLTLGLGVGRDDQVAGSTALILWSACGAMLMTGAGNLMMVFLGLELLSLGLYCLCAISVRATARESALKYLILSSMASGFLLFGMALLFGASGSVALSALAATKPSLLLLLGSGLFFVGIAFKLSLVPFHVWTPDVYEGAPLAVTAFMSVVTKAGALAVLGRFAYAALPPDSATAILVPVWAVAALSMLVGNLAALSQTDMKRLLAYSGIAQVGYIVAAFAGQTAIGVRYAIFYLAAYTFMNLGAFAVVALMSRDADAVVGIGRFAGLAYRRPWLAALMSFFLLGLAGLPPTAGFTGKVLILASTVGAGYAWLGGVLILGTAISIYVYFKIVRAMFSRVDEAHVRDERSSNPLPWITVAVCAAAVFVLGLFPLTPSNVLPLVH